MRRCRKPTPALRHTSLPPSLLRFRLAQRTGRAQAVQMRSDDPLQYYTDMKKLGQGASGTVYSGTDVRTGEKCALKFCPIAEVGGVVSLLCVSQRLRSVTATDGVRTAV
jgi:serine/threonine protein kinase